MCFHNRFFGGSLFAKAYPALTGACVSWCRVVEFGKSLWNWPASLLGELEYIVVSSAALSSPASAIFLWDPLKKKKGTRNVQPYFSHCFVFNFLHFGKWYVCLSHSIKRWWKQVLLSDNIGYSAVSYIRKSIAWLSDLILLTLFNALVLQSEWAVLD